jgi:tripartite-type tricarboxylate transporter receptor subunit TctC
VLDRLNAAGNDYLQSDKGKQQLLKLDLQASGGTAQEAKDFIRSEIIKWGPVIKAAHIVM